MVQPPRRRPGIVLVALAMVAVLVTACGQAPPATTADPSPPSASGGSGDLLATVRARGKLLIATDANYQPQSYRTPEGAWEGFDIDVAREVSERLGVEPEFLDISFDIITAGNWNGRWDINVGSMTITASRREALIFTDAYYYTPAVFAVHADSDAAAIGDLEGSRIGVGASTTYLDYLNGALLLEDEGITTPAPTGEPRIYDTDILAINDLALGDGTRLDAVLTALPTIDQAIRDGRPIRILGEPVFYESLAIALDRTSAVPSQPLADAISTIIKEMQADGTLAALSQKYYGIDITSRR